MNSYFAKTVQIVKKIIAELKATNTTIIGQPPSKGKAVMAASLAKGLLKDKSKPMSTMLVLQSVALQT
jgi:DNA replication protein DnaC